MIVLVVTLAHWEPITHTTDEGQKHVRGFSGPLAAGPPNGVHGVAQSHPPSFMSPEVLGSCSLSD